MAQVTIIKVVEGPSDITIRVNLMGDGTGELRNFPILAATSLNPSKPNGVPSFNIRQAWWGFVWFDVTVFAGTLSPAQLFTFTRDTDSHVDFRSFGGLLDQNVYADPLPDDNGILNISTNNFVIGSAGTLVLQIQKTNRVSG